MVGSGGEFTDDEDPQREFVAVEPEMNGFRQ
jgi:hypothetical protein